MATPQVPDKEWLAGVPRFAIAIAVAAMLLGVFWLDRVTELSPDLTVLYLVPIVLATYAFGLRWGLLVTAAAALGGLFAHPHGHFPVVAIDTATHYAVFLLTAVAVDRLARDLRTIRRFKARRDFDLDSARSVNLALLEAPRSGGGFRVGWRSRFARELGGDYYLVNGTSEGLFVCVGDISGKGVQAALFTALLHDTVADALGESLDLRPLTFSVNRRLHHVMPSDMFMTMYFAMLTPSEIHYVNAGHEPALLKSAGDGSISELSSEGLVPLGIMDDIAVPVTSRAVGQGDMLLVYTDGITTSPRFRERPEDLLEIVAAFDGADPQALADLVFSQAVPTDETMPSDDTTVLAVAWEDGDAAGRLG